MEIKLVQNIKNEIKKDLTDIKKRKYNNKIVMTPETFAKVFSPQKVRLLLKLKDADFNSISDLAIKLNRKFESVHRDINYLLGLGLIKIRKEKKNVIPIMNETIQLPII